MIPTTRQQQQHSPGHTWSDGLHDVVQDEQSFGGDLVEAVIHSRDHCWDNAANVWVEHRGGVASEQHRQEIQRVYLHVRSGGLITRRCIASHRPY